MSTPSRSAVGWLLLALMAVAFVVTTWPLRVPGSQNSRMLVVFYTDEALHFNQVASALKAHTYASAWDMGYGYVFFNLVQSILLLRAPVSEQQIVLTLRTVEWAAALALLVFVFVAVRRVSLRGALMTTALVATMPVVARWSAISHPDILQVLFVWIALDACARRLDHGRRVWTLIAAAAAGLAFASKFVGMFLLPIVWAADLMADSESENSPAAVRLARVVIVAGAVAALAVAAVFTPSFVAARFTSDGSIAYGGAVRIVQLIRVLLAALGVAGLALAGVGASWRRVMASPVGRAPVLLLTTMTAFLGAFTVTSPQAWRGLHFARALIFNASVPASEGDQTGSWVRLLVGGDMFSAALLLFAAGGAVHALMRVREIRGRGALDAVHASWVVIFLGSIAMSLRGHMQPPHYLLPLVPSVLFLAVRGWEAAWDRLPSRVTATGLAASLLLVGAFAAELTYDARRVLSVREEILDRERNSRPVQFGERLGCYISPRARVLFDYFSYVPPAFVDARPTWGGTLTLLDEQRPDAIIVNATIENFYRAPGGESDGSYRYYAALRDNRTNYRLVATDTPVRLYVRADSPNVVSVRGCS